MLFSSLEFLLIFLPIALLGFYGLARLENASWIRGWLLLCSLFFYAYWDWRYLPLMLFSIGFNYAIGQRLRSKASKAWLTFGVSLNLVLLGYFKYVDFFIETLNEFGAQFSALDIVLPLAISFFTFQQISYLVDAHRGKTLQHDPLQYALFVCYFPQLIAGPIVHHGQMLSQFSFTGKIRFFDSPLVSTGLILFIVGLCKKVIIADQVGAYVDPLFGSAMGLNFWEAWTAAIGYTIQLYFDFSGYSEMAMGIAMLFGITLPKNFDSPYRARSIADFWRRWHMTLGQFLREYLYIPLGGGRNGVSRQIGALFTTMLLGGLWHGAGWTFVLWGGLHGIYLAIYHCAKRLGLPALPKAIGITITLSSVIFAWVLFRAGSLEEASHIWMAMSGMDGISLPSSLATISQWISPWIHVKLFGSDYHSAGSLINGNELYIFAVLLAITVLSKNVHEFIEYWSPRYDWAIATAAGWTAALYFVTDTSYFLYMQF